MCEKMLIPFIVHNNYDRTLFSPTKSRKVLAGAKEKKEDLGSNAGSVLGTPV